MSAGILGLKVLGLGKSKFLVFFKCFGGPTPLKGTMGKKGSTNGKNASTRLLLGL